MNISLLTIGISSAMPAQSVRSNSVRGTDKINGLDELFKGNCRISSRTERSTAKKWDRKSREEAIAQSEEAQSSDNNSRRARISEKESRSEGFRNVLRRRSKPNQSDSKTDENEVATKPQITSLADKDGQDQPLIQSALVEQKQPTTDSSTANQILEQTESLKTGTSLQGIQCAVAENQGNGIQNNVLQQSETALNAMSNQMKSQQVTIVQGENFQQNDNHAQIAGTREASAEERQTPGKTSAIQMDSVEGRAGLAPLKQSAELNLATQSGVDNTSTGSHSQPDSPQYDAHLTGLSSGQVNVSHIQEKIAAGQQQGEAEATKNVKVKYGSDKDQQGADRKLSGDTQEAGGFSQKIEKAELFTVKSDAPKSESGSDSNQALQGQIGAFGTSQSVAANPAVITGHTAINTANSPGQDNAASVREQIYQSVKVSVEQGTSQITIRLNPPELGQVSVKFSERANELTGLLEATNPQTRAEIRHAIPEIIRTLEESGITIKRLDVMLSDLPRQSTQQQLLRDNSSAGPWEQFSHTHSQAGRGGQGFNDTPDNHFSQDSYAMPVTSAGEIASAGHVNFNQEPPSSADELLNVLI